VRERPGEPDQVEQLGRRIAAHRAKLGWTQQELADRLAISRVAVSHLEAGMTAPGERTVALLAGLFKVEPHELVAATDYPAAKAERLPVVVNRYTEVELQLQLFESDLRWLEHVGARHAEHVLARWDATFGLLQDTTHDERERAMLSAAHRRLRSRRSSATEPPPPS
jgi:transcriptional regulator with XRE-family HTH domain